MEDAREQPAADQKTNLGGLALAAGAIALAGGLNGAWKNRRAAKPRFHRSMTDAMVDLTNFGYWNEELLAAYGHSLPELKEYARTKAEQDWDSLPDSARQNLATMPATKEAVDARFREISLMPGYAQPQAIEQLRDRVRHLFPASLAEFERQAAASAAEAQAAEREAQRLRRSSEEESRKRAAEAAPPPRTQPDSIQADSTSPGLPIDALAGAVKVWQGSTAANYATQRAILEGRW